MPKTSSEFQKLYKQLNPEQKKAVDTVEGPVMVIAGPGTGKTQILTLRIANILLRTDADPENILALTFTDAGASTMRKRLLAIAGPAAYRVTISTFHSFCNDIIQAYPEEFPRIIGAAPMTQVEQIEILVSLLNSLELKRLTPYGDKLHYLRDIKGAIDTLKRENIDANDFEKRIKKQARDFDSIDDLYHEKGAHKGKMKGKYAEIKKEIEKNRELSKIYLSYEEVLESKRLYDFNDMIMEVVKGMQNNDELLLSLQERYQYILADEHQDANTAQNTLLELLASYYERPNLFIVGDEKQAIFRFQGASLENFQYFKKRFKDVELIALTKNYRSTQAILNASHSVIEHSKADIERPHLVSNKKVGGKPVQISPYSSKRAEQFGVVTKIAELIDSGVSPSEIAILYRTNNEAFAFADFLQKKRIAHTIESDQNLLENAQIKKLIYILRAVENFGDDEYLVPVLHIDFLNIEPIVSYKLLKQSHKDGSLYELIKKHKNETHGLFHLLSEWKKYSHNNLLTHTFERIVQESGYLAYILQNNDPFTHMELLDSLYDEIRQISARSPGATLADFVRHLQLLTTHKILVSYKPKAASSEHVHLMTAHKAKGQEFAHVFVVGASDGNWGNRRKFGSFMLPLEGASLKSASESENDDERRLFYVALTRAKEMVEISYAQQNENGREQLGTVFIAELDQNLIQESDVSKYEEKFEKEKDLFFAPAPPERSKSIENTAFVREKFSEIGLSVTALNNYLECPWKYFYRNLLRVPESMSEPQMYGNAVHGALSHLFKKHAQEGNFKKEILLSYFVEQLSRQPLTTKEREELLQKGTNALSGYFDTYSNTWVRTVETDFKVRGVLIAEGIMLRGELDKVEFIGDKVNVVDYKTAKPKSRNDIMGQTYYSDGNYFRQLIFYNILLNRYMDGKYKMVSGEIDFIEPNERGIYKKEKFEIDDSQIVELEKEILRVANEIMTLSFWDKKCNKKECEYCELRELMI